MKKIPEWIYMPINLSPELEKTFEAVEKALGFKLFIWQKTFIAHGTYRKSGRTTAEILRDLLDVSKPPLDYTKPVTNHMERFYREETRQIKAKLDAAGIPTRIIFFSRQEKQNYYSKTEAQAAGRKARKTEHDKFRSILIDCNFTHSHRRRSDLIPGPGRGSHYLRHGSK